MRLLKNNILFLFIGLCLGLLIMSFNIKDEIVPLSNGELPIITFDKGSITSNEYYNELKTISGIDNLLDSIDTKLLEEYNLDDEAIKNTQKEMNETIKLYMNYYDTTEEEFLNTSGFKDKDSFLKYMILEKKRQMYLSDYLKEKVTNQEINYYYINKMNNDIEIKYIKGNSEVLGEILTKLKEGIKLDEIIKTYKNITYMDLGYIAFDDENINEDIYSDAYAQEENSYTESLRSINDEYYIIFKGKVKEKDDVSILKKRIIKKIVEEKISNDEDNTLYKEALINLRSEHHIKFNDTYLENLYKTYCKKN